MRCSNSCRFGYLSWNFDICNSVACGCIPNFELDEWLNASFSRTRDFSISNLQEELEPIEIVEMTFWSKIAMHFSQIWWNFPYLLFHFDKYFFQCVLFIGKRVKKKASWMSVHWARATEVCTRDWNINFRLNFSVCYTFFSSLIIGVWDFSTTKLYWALTIVAGCLLHVHINHVNYLLFRYHLAETEHPIFRIVSMHCVCVLRMWMFACAIYDEKRRRKKRGIMSQSDFQRSTFTIH